MIETGYEMMCRVARESRDKVAKLKRLHDEQEFRSGKEEALKTYCGIKGLIEASVVHFVSGTMDGYRVSIDDRGRGKHTMVIRAPEEFEKPEKHMFARGYVDALTRKLLEDGFKCEARASLVAVFFDA